MFKKNSSFLILFLLLIVSLSSVAANKKKNTKKYSVSAPVQASLIVDGKTGKVLHANNAKQKVYPASLTKVMTIYLVFESLKVGKVNLDQKFYVSKHATQALPCKLYLKQGQYISVKDAISALSVKSANDVARVVAENISGSESKFAKLMNMKARQLGMKNTNFTNASGWHDPKQFTTAVDLAKLSIAIKRDFPEYYHFFKKTSFTFNGRVIAGHNKLTEHYPGAEGLKTGYHIPAGFNLITVATRGNKSLVGVVTGGKSSATRNNKMVALLDEHFGVKTKFMQTDNKHVKKKKKRVNQVKVASRK